MPTAEVYRWAQAQWGKVALGDERRQRRAVAVGAALAQASARSLPQQMASAAATKAAYRLMNCQEVTHWTLSEAHRKATRPGGAGPRGAAGALCTGWQLSGLQPPQQPGRARPYIGDGRGRGFCLQSCLALEAKSGRLLGLAEQVVWARGPKRQGETRSQRAKRRCESALWAECLEAMGPVPPGACWVSVADRAADVYGHL